MSDLKFAFRQLLKYKGSSLLAVLILALGIGGTTAVYSVADKVLLNPIPGRDADRLIVLGETDVLRDFRMGVSPPVIAELSRQTNAFDALVAFENHAQEFRFNRSEGSVKLTGARVAPGLFELLNARPVMGRTFQTGDGLPGHEQTIIASHGLWQREHGGRPDFVGSTITLNDKPHTVVGVMAPSFQFPFGEEGSQFWIPYQPSPEQVTDPKFRMMRQFTAIARLQPDVSKEQAHALLATLNQRWQLDHPDQEHKWIITSTPVRSLFVSETIERTLWSLQTATGILLLIACANVGVLLLARALARKGEFSVRMALGAGCRRIVKLLLTENVLLAGLAGTIGIICAWGGIHGVQQLFLQNIPGIRELNLDWSSFAVAAAVAFGIALLFSAAPLWFVSRLRLNEGLKDGAQRHGGGKLQTTFQDGLVVVQISLALVLLSGSGLMIQSTVRLLTLDPGLNPKNLYVFNFHVDFQKVMQIDADTAGLTRGDAILKRAQELVSRQLQWLEISLEKIAAVPGVESAAMGAYSSGMFDVVVDGTTGPFHVQQKAVGVRRGNYFETIQARLLEGRTLNAEDALPGADTVVVGRKMADQCWPGRNPIGGRISIRAEDYSADLVVVGVVEDVRDWRRDLEVRPSFFVPTERMTEQFIWDPSTLLFARSTLGLGEFSKAVKEMGLEMLPSADSPSISSVEQIHSRSTAPRRILMWLLVSMGTMGLLLSLLGIYALMAYAVVRRTREVGIRMAVGAQRNQIRNLFIRRGMRLTINGTVLGLIAAFTGARYIESLLFQVKPDDPWSFAGAIVILAFAAALACWLPARRAAKTDPMTALRME
jgi:predicted permease